MFVIVSLGGHERGVLASTLRETKKKHKKRSYQAITPPSRSIGTDYYAPLDRTQGARLQWNPKNI